MTRTILLADDSVTIQKVVELSFVQNGYDVVAVGSGEEALERLETVSPDVVIADVHMPGASGYDVCRAVKQKHPDVPVILLVGAFERFDEGEYAACGADQFLKKPFDSKELFERVHALAPIDGEAPSAGGQESAASPTVDDLIPAIPIPDPQPAASAGAAEVAADAPPAAAGALSDDDVDRIARRVVELVGDEGVREIAWEVIPDLAEIVIKDRIRELESQVE